MNPLIAKLQKEYSNTSDSIQGAEIYAELAANWARVGEFDTARQMIKQLREIYGDGRSGQVTVWIMLAEGLLHLFERISPEALDRVKRAQLLSQAMGYKKVVAISSAWKAHMEFEFSKYESMADSIKIALQHAAADDHDALARIAMVLSNSMLICGRTGEATTWFKVGHSHAVRNGDRASIEALLYNRAAFSLGRLRIEQCQRTDVRHELRAIAMEIKSSINLQQMTQVATLSNHLQLCHARVLMLEERFESAMEKLLMIRNQAPFAEHNFSPALIDLEIVYCNFRLDHIAAALDRYLEIDFNGLSKLDTDEMLVAVWMRLTLAQNDSRFGNRIAFDSTLTGLLKKHSDSMNVLSQLLSRIGMSSK